MYYVSPGNSTNPRANNASNPGKPMPFLGVFGAVVGLSVAFLMFYMIRIRYQRRQPQRDVEAAKSEPKETVDLQILDDANPSQQYEAVKGLKKQATWVSVQSNSAEVCAICLEVLVDQDNVRRLKCKHVFHTSCIDSWFQSHHFDCPLCKSIFIPNRRSNQENIS